LNLKLNALTTVLKVKGGHVNVAIKLMQVVACPREEEEVGKHIS
jgi:hypothetical protein